MNESRYIIKKATVQYSMTSYDKIRIHGRHVMKLKIL